MFPFAARPEVIAVFIPILVVLGVFAAIITGIIVGGKHKELAHRERILAMEKGIPIPREPKVEKRPAHLTMRAWGFVLLFLGIALVVALWGTAGVRAGVWGLLPAGVGAAMLLAARQERGEMKKGGPTM